jgi:predicted CopG family antitoxin
MTKVVQLSDEAYARLRSRKRPGESFSAVVLRLTRRRGLEALQGSLTDAEAQRATEWILRADELDR